MKQLFLRSSIICIGSALAASCSKHEKKHFDTSMPPRVSSSQIIQYKQQPLSNTAPILPPPSKDEQKQIQNKSIDDKPVDNKPIDKVSTTEDTQRQGHVSPATPELNETPSKQSALPAKGYIGNVHTSMQNKAAPQPVVTPKDGWDFIPKDFQSFLRKKGSILQAFFGKTSLGMVSFKLNHQTISLLEPDDFLNKMGLKSSVIDYIKPILQKGIPIGQPIICPADKAKTCKSGDTLFVITQFSLRSMKALMSASPTAFKVIPTKNDSYYLPDSSSHSISNRVNYNALASYSLSNSLSRNYNLCSGQP